LSILFDFKRLIQSDDGSSFQVALGMEVAAWRRRKPYFAEQPMRPWKRLVGTCKIGFWQDNYNEQPVNARKNQLKKCRTIKKATKIDSPFFNFSDESVNLVMH
jgi:hypothetical protein